VHERLPDLRLADGFAPPRRRPDLSWHGREVLWVHWDRPEAQRRAAIRRSQT
jgi:hypothetical protein